MARPRQEVMRTFREEDVGGRLVYSLTGSSPIAPEVLVFLRGALQAPTYEGYGSTEAGYVRPASVGSRSAGVTNVCTARGRGLNLPDSQCAPVIHRLGCHIMLPDVRNLVVDGGVRPAADVPVTRK